MTKKNGLSKQSILRTHAVKLLFFLISILCSHFLIVNTEFGWRAQSSYENYLAGRSFCKAINGFRSPTEWYENIILQPQLKSGINVSNRSTIIKNLESLERGIYYNTGFLNYDNRGFYFGTIALTAATDFKNLECWANYGDVIALLAYKYKLGEGQGLTYPSKLEILKLNSKANDLNAHFFLQPQYLNSNCNKALSLGLIICRKYFPEVFLSSAQLICDVEKDNKKAKYYLEKSYRMGLGISGYYLSSNIDGGFENRCKKGDL